MSKRYIEADRAIDALKAIRYGLWEIDIPSSTVPEYVEHHEQIKNMMEITDGWIKKLEEQSTADVVERKRGRWLAKSFHEVYCDKCGFDFDIMKNEFIDKMKYCPNCGADMREGTGDDND